MSADDTGALGYDAPTDLDARVVDRDGDVWARHEGVWGCLTTASAPQVWHDLVNVCGPLHLAARVQQARAGEGALRESARPIVAFLDDVEAFYGDESYDTEDIVDTPTGSKDDPNPLRWSDLRRLRAALTEDQP